MLCLGIEQGFPVSFTVSEMEGMRSYDGILLALGEKLR
jgi:hypothetical protein